MAGASRGRGYLAPPAARHACFGSTSNGDLREAESRRNISSPGTRFLRASYPAGMKQLPLAALSAAVLFMAACSVSVDHDRNESKADVQIRTPVGNVLVKTGDRLPETGLAVYPGSTPVRRHREAESANVAVESSFFGVKVAAANFASDASPQAIVDYYKRTMRTLGPVTECHGNIDFRGRRGQREPVCHGRGLSRTTQLAVGTEDQHRLVSVKQRGSGSEYSLVYVRTHGT